MISLTCRILKKGIQMNLFAKQKQIHRHRKQTYGFQRGEGRGINQEFGIEIYKLLYIKQITNKNLLYSIGNYIQYLVKTYNGREYQKIYVYIHRYGLPGWLSSKETACNVGYVGSSLGWEDPLEKDMKTHSNILTWRIPIG